MKPSIYTNKKIYSIIFMFFSNLFLSKDISNLICNNKYLELMNLKIEYFKFYTKFKSIIKPEFPSKIKILKIKFLDEYNCLVDFSITLLLKDSKSKYFSKANFTSLLTSYSNKWLIYCLYDSELYPSFDDSSSISSIKYYLDEYISNSIRNYNCLLLNIPTINLNLYTKNNESDLTRNKSFDNTKAALYAEKHALNYNDKYKSFDKNGGDCTNFVSQAIYHGGVITSNTWKPYTNAWVRVIELHDYLINNNLAYKSDKISEKSIGSIIQFFNPNRKTWTHSGIITHVLESTCLYCCHSYDKLNYPLEYVYPDIYPKIRIISPY